jgi:alkanesulfonate monooxygenase SsuD/methylene tetrahydromethanopterin reductase-like flavin-dependent oxidoreductase (luciferase family)
MLAALRPRMLRLAAAEADGTILNWLAATDLPQVLAELKEAGDGFEVAARIFVCPTEDAGYARAIGRRLIAAYLTVPAYAEFHRWLGREPVLGPVWTAWAAGDRKAALAAIPDSLVDELIVHGSPEQCRERVAAYAAAGVGIPVMALLTTPELEKAPGTLTTLLTRLGR